MVLAFSLNGDQAALKHSLSFPKIPVIRNFKQIKKKKKLPFLFL